MSILRPCSGTPLYVRCAGRVPHAGPSWGGCAPRQATYRLPASAEMAVCIARCQSAPVQSSSILLSSGYSAQSARSIRLPLWKKGISGHHPRAAVCSLSDLRIPLAAARACPMSCRHPSTSPPIRSSQARCGLSYRTATPRRRASQRAQGSSKPYGSAAP